MLNIIASANANLPFPGNPPITFNLWHLRDEIYYLNDSLELGNMLLCNSPQGLVVVDSKIPGCYPALNEFICDQFKVPLKWVINTHCHPDHAGGNPDLCQNNPQIIAHANCAARLAQNQQLVVIGENFAALPSAFRPNLVFDSTLTLNLDAESLIISHLPGHTDNDLTVFCTNANVIHTGDLCSFGGFPYLGLNEGANINSMINSLWKLHDSINDQTIVVPGHGAHGNRQTLKEYIMLLSTAVNNVKNLTNKGAKLQEILANKPAADLAKTCRTGVGPLNQSTFEELLYLAISCEER